MRNLLALVAVLVIVFAAVGWYLNWYNISTSPMPEGRHQVTIDFDGQKITQDLQEGGKRVADFIDNAGDRQDNQGKSGQTSRLPSFSNPYPQANQPEPAKHETNFEQTADGFFVLPGDFPAPPRE